jgi:carbamoyltransferase
MYFAGSILMRILGISPAHDSSIAIVNDGKLECFLKEERYSRIKRDKLPWKAIEHVYGKIDKIVYTTPTVSTQDAMFKAILQKKFACPIIDMSDQHHLCHASLAFYNSDFGKALVFVIDRNGSVINNVMREAETVYQVEYPYEFKTLHKNYWVFNRGADADSETLKHSTTADSYMSVVKVYETATTLIGQNPLENGKTMGLAAYGKDTPYKQFFVDGRPNDTLFVHDYFVTPDQTTTLMRDHIGKVVSDVPEIDYEFYANHAYQVQKQTQEYVLEMIKYWVNKTGIKEVCITGGYALNVVANSFYVENLPDVKFYFEPMADDSGNSIGAAMYQSRIDSGSHIMHGVKTPFIHGLRSNLKDVGEVCLLDDVINLIEQQKTVAMFCGFAEGGQRALGNRSILFDARNPNAKDIVNKIKKREWYRPFAATVLEEDFEQYFYTLGLEKSAHMTMSFKVKNPDLIPGVVHVDNSCRVQTTTSHSTIGLVLQFLKKKTGCGVLLNTSFNMAGEPLVETQEDAINTFNNSDIDVLWFPEIGKCLKKDTL